MAIKELASFYLVGGTALALLLGHRDSVDIDLFTHAGFDTNDVENALKQNFTELNTIGQSKHMYFAYVNGVKIDFVNNFTPLQYPLRIIDDLRIADIKDIATLKLKAIFNRGSKKDFIDLFCLLQQLSVEELVKMFSIKYPSVDIGQLLLSMHYFEDAEAMQQPKLYINKSWDAMKKIISQKVISYIKKG